MSDPIAPASKATSSPSRFREIFEAAPSEEPDRLEAAYREAQKLESLGLLAGGIAHEFNNLLQVVMGNAELVAAQLPDRDDNRLCLGEIQRAAERAAEVCRQMLVYCGKGEIAFEPLSFCDLVAEVSDLLRISMPQYVELELHLDRSPATMLGDAGHLRQVLINLVTNAGEAMGERPGTVRLETGFTECDEEFLSDELGAPDLEPGAYQYLEVGDDGCGMDASTLERLYDPFFTTKFPGRGLGMAAVSGIVRAHRGAIQAASLEGMGSVFRVFLPITQQPAVDASLQPAVECTPAIKLEAARTVLLADDELPVLNLARRLLEHAGFEVVTAHDGNEAVQRFLDHQEEITAVLLDLVMPRMGGEEALSLIRERSPQLPVIISSGYTEVEISSLLAADPCLGFLQKPYSLASLRTKLEEMLG